MNPQLNVNYIKLDNNLYFPYYIYNKLLILNSDTNDLKKLISYYNTNIFYTSIKTKILKFAANLFDVDCELWSNPFICIRQFCSNNTIDFAYGGIESIENFNPQNLEKKCAILVDQRPDMKTIPSDINCDQTNHLFKSKLKNAFNILKKLPSSYPFTLIIMSLNKIDNLFSSTEGNIQASQKCSRLSSASSIQFNQFNINNNLYIYFFQTSEGYRNITPTNTKIDILISFVKNKESVSNLQINTKKRQIILGRNKANKCKHVSHPGLPSQ